LFDCVKPCPALENELKRCIQNAQELSDAASPKLAEIRRDIKRANDRIREQLGGVIQSSAYRTMLQDAIITTRGGRYCVPVKAEFAGSFPGMIHDQSSSGATVFIEPAGVVQLNNKIKELQFAERDETERILYALGGAVAGQGELLAASAENITELDFIFAKGELALAMRATRPVFNREGVVNIKKGRHPLIGGDAVPIDIYLGEGFNILLITGPNTGGKTVSLKTLGLLSCMGQAGLHIPANDNSRLAVFDEIFADIGDEQSIEQSLSTFSSHMTNIVNILDALTDDSLVLLDELGAGTDPTEGAALAVALLRYLLDRNIRAAVTTHYSELKVFALGTEGVENASCEFDVETLRPTYRLLIGVPGKSNAFAVSRRLGLPEHIIEHARGLLSREDVRFEDVLTDLEINRKAVMLEKERAEQYRREAEHLKRLFEQQQERLASQREKILKEAREEALALTREAKQSADEMYKNFQKMLREGASHKEIEDARGEMRERAEAMEGAARGGQTVLRPLPERLQKGDRVFIHSLNSSGTALGEPGEDGEVTVQAGILKIKVNVSDLSLDDSPARPEGKKAARPQGAKIERALNIRPETDLRGMTVEEGVENARKYLDDAYLAGLPQVTLIHGKGTGALRKAIQNLLKTHAHVKSYRLGAFGEGGDGVTVAEMK
jgi:DNA mismatch repair protein MutS2